MKKPNKKAELAKQKKAEKRNRSSKKREKLRDKRIDERNQLIEKKKAELLELYKELMIKKFNDEQLKG